MQLTVGTPAPLFGEPTPLGLLGLLFAVDVAFILIFLVLTYAFGFYSKVLVAFLVDIDLLYLLRVARRLAPGVSVLGPALGIATVVLGLIALYIALAMLVNGASGRTSLPLGGPLFHAAPGNPG